ncbi:MAG: glycosyltransferase [Planctomycetota bacterium]
MASPAESSRLLSVLMPVYNEYAFVRECVRRVLAAPLPEGLGRELVLVDDGSTDGTRDILAELDDAHPEVRVILHEKNQGKGAAIRTAIREMRGEFALFQDADLEYDPGDYARVLRPLVNGYADVVYGSRFAYSEERRVLLYHHMLGNLFLTHLSNFFTGLNLTDMETCYKAFRASVLRTIPIRSHGFGLEPEITAKVAKRDCVVYEVPIAYHGRSYDEGKKITWRDGVRAFGVILKYWAIDDCWDERYGHEVLAAMSDARRYARWVADLARPHLGHCVLELGSGIGNMSRHLLSARRFIASDVDPIYLEQLKSQYAGRENVAVGPLDATKAEDYQRMADRDVDTVVAFNMLEHLEDDGAAIRAIHDLLPTGGRLILQVPQYASLFSVLDRELDHHRRYDQLGLRGLLVKNGYEVDVMRSINWMGLPGWWLNGKVLRRKKFSKIQLKIFDALVPIQRWTAWLPLPGLSIFAVARKR